MDNFETNKKPPSVKFTICVADIRGHFKGMKTINLQGIHLRGMMTT